MKQGDTIRARRDLGLAAVYVITPVVEMSRVKIGASTKPEEVLRVTASYSPIPVRLARVFWTQGPLVAQRILNAALLRIDAAGAGRSQNWHSLPVAVAEHLIERTAEAEGLRILPEAEVSRLIAERVGAEDRRLAAVFAANPRA